MSSLTLAAPLPTTLDNFFMKGTQPDTSGGVDFKPMITANSCRNCHEFSWTTGDPLLVVPRWESSMMANAFRDPVFQAALTIANQDAAFAGDLCLRCHAPGGWLGGRSVPTDGSAMRNEDFEGVTCHFCHRLVDPVPSPENPPQDDPIRAALAADGLLPSLPGNGSYVVDPTDVRRGPFALDPNAPVTVANPPYIPRNMHAQQPSGLAPIIESALHSKGELCGTCHDVSNPAFTRQPNGTYALNAIGVPHATQNKYDMFPIERTFSEWSNSTYALFGVDAHGVFGGNIPGGVVSQCQDCHMPPNIAYGCGVDGPDDPFFERDDMPVHNFNGGNAWVQDMLQNLYGIVPPEDMQASQDRARYMLMHAATMEVTDENCRINVRITNETGHKLPSGYPEGRRMWLNVQFRGDNLSTITEHGAYDAPNASLTTVDTQVYEVRLGLDAQMAGTAGLPEGESFHFALNNKVYKDNRIPPRGFVNAAFASVQAAPVGATFDDGQYWSDTKFHIPPGATSAVVSLYYQTSSREYITFLRDQNQTNDSGDTLYEQWQLTGMSPPVLMQQQMIAGLSAGLFGDADCSGSVFLPDVHDLEGCVTGPEVRMKLGCEAMDDNLDGDVDLLDYAAFQVLFTGPN